jgi:hypothetical protein
MRQACDVACAGAQAAGQAHAQQLGELRAKLHSVQVPLLFALTSCPAWHEIFCITYTCVLASGSACCRQQACRGVTCVASG